jgi:hypothetical protein
LGFALACALAATMIATMLLGSLLSRAPRRALLLPDAEKGRKQEEIRDKQKPLKGKLV